MALRRDPQFAPPGAALDALLRSRLEHARPSSPGRRRLGIEHEYAVFDVDRQTDFRQQVHHLGFPGRPLHPTNTDMYLTPSGLAVMADGLVAEIASPPELLCAGSASALDAWAARGRALLEAHIDASLTLLPGSTHLSVEMRSRKADQICLWYAQTFAPALMLLMDNASSPGHLVRPRPSRLEIGGEFVQGTRLRAAATFLAGSVLALESARRLPPAVQVRVEPARRRYGWYIDRTAFGPDLYTAGRAALLTQSDGGTVTAQQHMEACWAVARDALGSLASHEDIEAVEQMLRGAIPLPCEQAEWVGPAPADTPPTNRYGRLTVPHPSLAIEPVVATWDFVAFAVSDGERQCILNIPEHHLDAFVDLAGDGALDDLLAAALEQPSDRILDVHAQTTQPSVFGSITRSDALLPRDRVGIGAGPVSTLRPGKIETPPPPPPPPPREPVTPHQDPPRTRWTWIGGGLIGLVALTVGGWLLVGGGDDAVADPTATPQTTIVQPTATSQVVDPTAEATGIAVMPLEVGPIVATLTVPVTTYTVEASSPSEQPLTYRWFLVADPGQECGTKSPANSDPTSSNTATWSHDSAAPDNCHHDTTDHPFTVTVEVSDGVNPPVQRMYRGSASGIGEQ